MRKTDYFSFSSIFVLVALASGQPADDVPFTAVLVDKKPHADEGENLKFYLYKEKVFKQSEYLWQKAIKSDPTILAAVPPEGKAAPIAWLQKHVQVDIDVKKHQIRISLPKADKKWQKAAALAVARECVKAQFPDDTKVEKIVTLVNVYLERQSRNADLKEHLIKSSAPKHEIDKCDEDNEKCEKKIQNLLAQLSPDLRLFLLEPADKPQKQK